MFIHRFIFYAMAGMIAEIFFTGIKSGIFNKDPTLKGTSYVWMFPIYGSMVFLEPIHNLIISNHILVRGTTYAALILLFEFITGSTIKKLAGKCPWFYNARFAVKGIIRLDYFPIWFVFGLVFEVLHKFIIFYF